ncbi:MAG TPA: hypothetical protein VLA05_00370, partial [Coriobacteriia bacterium]|nr:hypothetical protein [Coriobacteriia bacterium]
WNMEDLTPVHGAELLANEDCTYCHSTVFAGVPSHVQDVKGLHVTSDNMSGCACHVRNLTNEHARYTDDAGEQLSCITCHGPDVPQRVKDAMQLPTTPTCADCHDIPLGHPYAEVDHLADVGETADLSGFLCGDCHNVDLMAEHEKVSSSSAGGSCTTCHPTPRDSFDEWNQTCSQGGCHSVGSPQTMHAETTAAHTFPSPTPSCVEGCHSADGDNLATVHLDASVTTPGGEVRTSCMVCHADGVPSTNDCATCHPDRVAEHGYEAAMHTATLGSGGIALFDNHDGWMGATGAYMDCADCHNAELGDTHANLCSTCHPTPRNTFTGWSKNCTQGGCHATYHASGFDHDEIASGNCSACHDEGSFQLYDDPCVDCHAKPSAGDATAPVTTAAALANYNGTARIEFTMTDSGMVGIGTTFRKLDGAAATKGDLLEVSEGGSHSLEYWSVDQYGNEETPHKSLNFTVAPDSTPPVTTSNVKSAYEGPATITLSASDASYLGVKGTYYKLNGGATQTGTLVSIGQPASGTVAYTLEWWSDDYSGNVEGHHTASFTVTRDITPPVSTLSAQPYYKTATVSIPFAAVDTGYGVSQKAYKIDGGTTQFLSSAANNLTRTFTAQGPHTIEYWSIDRGGNTEVHRTATINVDWTVPTVSSNAATTYTETATITITAADLPANGAGLANIVYRVDGGTQQNAPSGAAATDLVVGGAGTHSIEYWALDNAGNSAVHAVKVFTIGGGTPTGNGTIRLVWGDSDVSGYVPLYDSWAAWTVRSGGASGPIVATGRGDAGVDGWDGVDDVTVPVSETPYYVYIDWFDADWWYDGPTIHPSVLVTYPGQVVRLSY